MTVTGEGTTKERTSSGKPTDVPTRKPDSLMRVAYIMSFFPKLTETFVLHEILEMQRSGVAIEIFPLLRGREKVVQPEAARLVEQVHYRALLSVAILASQWHFIRQHPRKYFRAMWDVMRGTFGSANFFFGAIGSFPKAVCFARDMEALKVTHVHAQFANHPAVAALIIHRLTDIPFSFTARGSDIHVERRMLKRKLEEAAFAITVSKFNKQVMIDECGQTVEDKIHVIFGGVDTDLLSPVATAPSGTFKLLCVGRFEEVKGQTHLVEACRLLRDRGIEFECHLIGDGPLRRDVEQQIANANLEDQFILHGARTHSEVIAQLAQTSVAVLPTVPSASGKREGIPNVLKEAMACGLPVAGSRLGGIPELVDHDRTGFLVPPGDAVALADALQKLHDNPDLRQDMGRAGRKRILEDFNLRKSTARRAALFKDHGRTYSSL